MMLELLKTTIDGDALGVWATLPAEERETLCRMAAEKNMEAYFYYFFNRELPEKFLDRFRHKYQINRALALKNEFYQKELFDLLSGSQIRFVPIKGWDLSANYYPDPALRSYSDWDILIHPDDISTALPLLERHGWEKTEPARKYDKVTYHHFPPLRKNDMLLEIHRSLPGFAGHSPEYVWRYIVRDPNGGAYDLSPELKLSLLVSHFSVDNYLHMPFVKFIVDVGWLLKKESINRDALQEISQEFFLPFPGDVLGACPDFFAGELLAQIGFDPQKATIYRKIFDYQNELNHSPGAEWVMNRQDRYSFKWWQTRLRHLKPSAIQKASGAPSGKITPASYLAVVLKKLFSFIRLSPRKNKSIAEYYKLVDSVKPRKK